MTRYQVVIKRIVSPDGKIIAEAKSVATVFSSNESEISQTVFVNVSSGQNSSISHSICRASACAK